MGNLAVPETECCIVLSEGSGSAGFFKRTQRLGSMGSIFPTLGKHFLPRAGSEAHCELQSTRQPQPFPQIMQIKRTTPFFLSMGLSPKKTCAGTAQVPTVARP
eukprot:scaffold323800_cov17-Tisochrysis_lutea.AAC.1